MVWQLPIAVSLSTLPIVLDVKTASCGVNADGLAKEHPEFEDIISKCHLCYSNSAPFLSYFSASFQCSKATLLSSCDQRSIQLQYKDRKGVG